MHTHSLMRLDNMELKCPVVGTSLHFLISLLKVCVYMYVHVCVCVHVHVCISVYVCVIVPVYSLTINKEVMLLVII